VVPRAATATAYRRVVSDWVRAEDVPVKPCIVQNLSHLLVFPREVGLARRHIRPVTKPPTPSKFATCTAILHRQR
jgi:hypothetical protein